jgi:hypothetical protein
MSGILQFAIQLLLTMPVAAIIADPYLSPWIVWPTAATPILAAIVMLKIPTSRLTWPFRAKPRKPRRMSRIVSFSIAVFFVLVHLTLSHLFRRGFEESALVLAKGQFASEVGHVAAALGSYASEHGGMFPDSLDQLPSLPAGKTAPVPSGIITDDEFKIDDHTAANLGHYIYFGAGRCTQWPGQPIYLLARKFVLRSELPGLCTDACDEFDQGDTWLLYTENSKDRWMSDAQFKSPHFQAALLAHQADTGLDISY